MSKGRPGGNPLIHEHGFKAEGVEPLTELLQLRITPSMMQYLKTLDDKNAFVRQAIADKM